jgi:hypothetical protein
MGTWFGPVLKKYDSSSENEIPFELTRVHLSLVLTNQN